MKAKVTGGSLPKNQIFLVKVDPVTPYFYMLPKIHKGLTPPPGRPIVSGINSVLEPLSQFCNFFLRTLVQQARSYLQDTKDVLNLIKIINEEGNTNLLVTLDVEALASPNKQLLT